jgi:hypothetical protein
MPVPFEPDFHFLGLFDEFIAERGVCDASGNTSSS